MPFANWHVDTTTATHQLRVTKKGEALLHSGRARAGDAAARATTRPRSGCCRRTTRCCRRWASPTSRAGSSRRARRSTARSRSSSEPCRSRSRTPPAAASCARPRRRTPLRVVDLGCGNAYLTFAAHAWLSERMPVRLVGRRRQGAVPAAQHRGRRGAGRRRRGELRGSRHPRRHAGRATRRRTGPARLRHRHRRRPRAGGAAGRPSWSSRRPAATTTSRPSCARSPLRRATPVSRETAFCESDWPTP